MKRINQLLVTVGFVVILFSCQKKDNESEQNSKKAQSQALKIDEDAKRLKNLSDSIEMAICAKVDSSISKEANNMLPWVYDKGAVSDVRFQEYDYLASLQKCSEINNTLSEADSLNERKLLKLFNSSPDAFPVIYWNITELWQLLHYEAIDGDDHETEYFLSEIAKQNKLSSFLDNYKKLYNNKLHIFVKATKYNSNLSEWKKLNAKGVKMYNELKRKAILANKSLDNDSFKNRHWQRDNL